MMDDARTLSAFPKVTGDIIWLAISRVITMSVGLITLPALTQNYSADLYGVWSQAIVTVGLLTPIFLLHLSTAVVRFLTAETDKVKLNRDFSAMLWAIIAFSCSGFFVTLIFRRKLSMFLFSNGGYDLFIPLIVLWASSAALFTFLLSYLRAKGKIKRISLINITLATGQMFAIVVFALSGFGLEWIMIFTIALEAVLSAVVLKMIVGRIGFPHFTFKGLKKFLIYSLPLLPFGVLLWVINASDRYFIIHFLNLSQTGIYSVSYTLGSLISLFYTPISFVILPILANFWEQKQTEKVRRYLEYSTKLFLFFAIPGSAGIYVLSQPLLRILTKAEYLVGGELVLLVTLGTMLLGIYQINVFVVYLINRTQRLPLIIGIAAVTNAALNIVLIPRIGILGAAISTIVAYFLLAVIVSVWAKRIVCYRVDYKFLGKIGLASLIMGLCLKWIPVTNIPRIVFAVIGGTIIYIVCLILLKALSKTDMKQIRSAFVSLKSNL